MRRRSPSRLILIAMGVVLAAGVIVQIVNQNVTNDAGDWDRYGALSVPGSEVFTLPAGTLDVILRDNLDAGVDIPAGLKVSVTAVDSGTAPAVLTRDVGQQFGSGAYGRNTSLKRVYRLKLAAKARYRVTVGGAGSDTPFRLDLGHAPGVGALTIWLYVLIAEAILLVAVLVMRLRGRGRSTD